MGGFDVETVALDVSILCERELRDGSRAWDGDGVRVWSCSFRRPGEPRLAVLHGCMAGQG